MRVLGLALGLCIAFTVSARADDNAAFNTAYTSYKSAVASGRFSQAAKPAKTVYELALKSFGADDLRTADAALAYARLLPERQAKRLRKKALQHYEAAVGKDTEALIAPLAALAEAAGLTGGGKEALPYYERALMLAAQHKPGSMNEGTLSLALGQAISLGGRVKQPSLRKSAQTLPPDIPPMSDPVLELLTRAETIFRTNGSDLAQINLAQTYDSLANHYRRLGDQAGWSVSWSLPTPELLRLSTTDGLSLSNHHFLFGELERRGEHAAALKHGYSVAAQVPFSGVPAVDPRYSFPQYAADNGAEGYVKVGLTVDEEGLPRDIHIVAGHNVKYFGDTALEAAKQLRFIPKLLDGKPVAVPGQTYKFTFDIAGERDWYCRTRC